jgi:phage-related protein
MNEKIDAQVPRTVTGNFEVAMALSQQRTIKMTGCTYSDDDVATVNARVDIVQDVLDRQFVRADITNKEAQIAAMEQNLENLDDSVQGLVKLRETGKSLNSQQKLQVQNYDASRGQQMKTIASLRAAIVAGRQKINGHDVTRPR